MKFKGIALVTGIIIVFWAALYFRFQAWELNRQLSYVPVDFGVSNILYKTEESWGGGPGGNETGIIVYELPTKSAEKILSGGVDYLKSLPQQPGDPTDWHGRYEVWGSTPILLDGDGGGPNRTKDYEIAHYLNRYGFGIPLEPKFEQEINAALSNPGCYLAYGRIGFLLIIPKSHRVVYAYNG